MASRDAGSTCLLCKSKYSGAGMTRHLQSCLPKSLQKQQKSKSQAFYHILVRGYYLSGYWLHLKVAANARLKDLDSFLRRIWLECCGHMSAFSYNRSELEMRQKLKDVLSPRMELLYEYDFGSTTELLIKVIGQYKGSIEEDVQVIARNAPPEILCDECGKSPAVQICTECQWDGTGWLCQACAEDHECGEDMMLPVVNSPRAGVCGYTGED
ncbi:MAG: hypothetical protein ACFFCW_35295 [Candidatus Hodarchaeota archaeon]